MTTGMRAMDDNWKAGNGWPLECRQWMVTGMQAMDGHRNEGNG